MCDGGVCDGVVKTCLVPEPEFIDLGDGPGMISDCSFASAQENTLLSSMKHPSSTLTFATSSRP